MKVAYLINQYPKVSHTFIRREIAALERLGLTVDRYAVRGWDADVVDPEDQAEKQRTQYLLRRGVIPLLWAALLVAGSRPLRLWAALRLAWRMGRREHRRLYHLVYLAEACAFLRVLRRKQADQLHAHFGTNAASVAALCQALGGPPFSFTVHGPEEFDRAPLLSLADKIRHANATIAISSYGRSQLWRWCAVTDWPKVHVVHCGLEAAFFGERITPVPMVDRLVCIGRLCEQKGQLLLVDAAALLAAEGLQFELVLAGDGEMRPEVESAIAKHRLAASVRITGWISSADVRRELLAARALVLTSFSEGLPVVIMEALALGRPVLSTYVAGIPELVRDGREGWLFPAGSVDAAAAAMRACLTATPAELQAMGASGRDRVMELHHVDTEAARLAAVWGSVAKASHFVAE